MIESTSNTFFEIIIKILPIVMYISAACSVFCASRAMHNLNTNRDYWSRYWFFITTLDALFVSDYYTKKGNTFRVVALLFSIICLFAMLALVISLHLAEQLGVSLEN